MLFSLLLRLKWTKKALHDECDRVAVTLHVVGFGAGANFAGHFGAAI
jgi:hypothetical protein